MNDGISKVVILSEIQRPVTLADFSMKRQISKRMSERDLRRDVVFTEKGRLPMTTYIRSIFISRSLKVFSLSMVDQSL